MTLARTIRLNRFKLVKTFTFLQRPQVNDDVPVASHTFYVPPSRLDVSGLSFSRAQFYVNLNRFLFLDCFYCFMKMDASTVMTPPKCFSFAPFSCYVDCLTFLRASSACKSFKQLYAFSGRCNVMSIGVNAKQN